MEYFYVYRLKPLKTANQLHRRRHIYKGFGLDFYLKDGLDRIVGVTELHQCIADKKRVMIVILTCDKGRIRVEMEENKFRIAESGDLELFKIGQVFDDYEFVHRAVTNGLDVRIN